MNQKPIGARLAKVLLPLLAVGLLIFGWVQRWNIYDMIRLQGYTPPAKIVQLASDTTMNDQTRRMFYAYHPELDAKDAFNTNCKSSEKTIVLGCFIEGQGLYIYDVTDERLHGVLQVTAAHEMLHAAYSRLNASDKAKVNAMIDAAYRNVTDERIRNTIDDYRKNGANTTNELHSILGSEVRSLPPDLENYYKRYFSDRAAIVSYSERYEQVFTDRKNQVAAYDAQLDSLKKQIDSAQADLDTRSSALTAQRNSLDGLLAAKNYSAYNAGVNSYNGGVSSYNALVRSVRALIDKYNSVVAARNAVVLEEGELSKAIDSRPNTIDTQQ